MDLVPVPRKTAAQNVADQLLKTIRQGHLKPGDQLPSERELMEKLEVGRSSIREALQILATIHVIEVLPGQGTFVKELKASDVLRPDVFGLLINNSAALELFEARQLVEPVMVRLACLRGTDEDFDDIEKLLNEHEAAFVNGRPVDELSSRFHTLLAKAAKNQVMVAFMESLLRLMLERGRNLESYPDYRSQELREHREIFELVKQRDEDRAYDAMFQHIMLAAPLYDLSEDKADEN